MTVAFLISVGRSGGLYTLSLFDGHPQVSCIPIELQFHRHWDLYGCDAIRDAGKLAEIILSQTRVARLKEGPFHGVTSGPQEWGRIDFDAFARTFRGLMWERPLSRRNTFLSLHEAYFTTLGRRPDDLKAIVEFGCFADWNAQRLADFPEARFLHLVRDPRAFLTSQKMVTYRHYDGLLHPSMSSLHEKFLLNHYNEHAVRHFTQMYDLQARLPGQVLVVRTEDMNRDLDATATRLSQWLDLDDLPCLRDSTMLGASFRGNSIYDTSEPAPHRQSGEKFRSSSHALERRALEAVYHKHMEHLGYRPDYIDHRSGRLRRLTGWLAWCAPFQGELTWIFNPKSRAFADREPSRPWLRGIWRNKPAVARLLRRSLVPYFLIRSLAVFVIQRAVIFSRMAAGKYRLDPRQIMDNAAAGGPVRSAQPEPNLGAQQPAATGRS